MNEQHTVKQFHFENNAATLRIGANEVQMAIPRSQPEKPCEKKKTIRDDDL